MKTAKAMGLDYVPVKIWRCLGEERLIWLIELLNVIFRTTKMPHECRISTVISLDKNKGDIYNCNNNRVIKALSYTMKLW